MEVVSYGGSDGSEGGSDGNGDTDVIQIYRGVLVKVTSARVW